MNSGAIALLVLVGAGGLVLLAQRTSLLPGNHPDAIRLRRGGGYRFVLSNQFNGEVEDLNAMGWSSVSTEMFTPEGAPRELDSAMMKVQAIWTGEDNAEWVSPPGMSNPEFLGMVGGTPPSRVPMQGPSQTTFPAQGLVNLNE